MTGVEFGFALFKIQAPAAGVVATDLRNWTAVTASVGSVHFIGIDGLTIGAVKG